VLRVTADTNILISGIIFPKGKPFHLLELAREGKINMTVSEPILDEMGDVLARKFGWPPHDIAEARRRPHSPEWPAVTQGSPWQRRAA
jgi:hypothetical protein